MTVPPLPPDELEQLAAELALGVLDGEQLAAAKARFGEDAEFRASVGRWLGRFSPLLDEVEAVEPPADLWRRIEQQLGSRPPANDNVRAIRSKLNLWRGIAAGASALAASLAVILVTRPPQVTPPVTVQAPAPMIAVLGDEQDGPMMVATWNATRGRLKLSAPAPMRAAADRTHELWVIPADGTPRSLGTMPASATIYRQVDPALSRELREGATLAISVEPRGGSPTGLPTGPVIATGKLERA